MKLDSRAGDGLLDKNNNILYSRNTVYYLHLAPIWLFLPMRYPFSFIIVLVASCSGKAVVCMLSDQITLYMNIIKPYSGRKDEAKRKMPEEEKYSCVLLW